MEREIALHYLFHVVLTHLDLVGREYAEEALLAVDNDTLDGIPSCLNAAYGIRVILIRLALDELKVERFPALFVKADHDAPVVPPVGRVQVHETGTGKRRLMPRLVHIAEAALDGGGAYAMRCSQF